jgi:hypothetical protein
MAKATKAKKININNRQSRREIENGENNLAENEMAAEINEAYSSVRKPVIKMKAMWRKKIKRI